MMTDEISERELSRTRLRFLDLLASFFQAEPDAEKMSRWRGTFSALAGEQVNPLFDGAVREFCRLLKEKSLAQIREEHYRLFVDPFSDSQVQTVASWYIDGRIFGASLVRLRDFYREAKLTRQDGVVDSEDSMVMLLDAFMRLVEEEKRGDAEQARVLQARLLDDYLDPCVAGLSAAVEAVDDAPFYGACCRLLRGYLDLEKGLVV